MVKIENITLKHEVAKLRHQLDDCQQTNAGFPGGHFGIHDVKDNDAKCKFYMGLTLDQFVGGIVWVQQKIKCVIGTGN